MKLRTSVCALTFVGFMLLGILNLATPISGFAGSPHPCPGGTGSAHLGNSLGGVASYTFVFAKNCAGDTSLAVRWKALVTNDDNGATLCQFPETALPPDTKSLACGPTLPPKIRLVLSWKTSALGSWMHHTHFSVIHDGKRRNAH